MNRFRVLPSHFATSRAPYFAAAWAFGLVLFALALAPRANALSSATSISFQGALTGADRQPLPDKNYNLTFKFYDVAAGGTALATSNVPNIPVTGGIASAPIPAPCAKSNCYPRSGIVASKLVLPSGLDHLVSCCCPPQSILTVNPTFP